MSKAWEEVREKCVFTTHTLYLQDMSNFIGMKSILFWVPIVTHWDFLREVSMNAGREDLTDLDSPLSMTVLGLKGSRKANGVSSLHGEVSREMFKHLDYPIGHITNGVHPCAWMAPEQAISSRRN